MSLNEYRFTRNRLYQADCPGRVHLSARNGHYITAESEQQARRQMCERYPEDAGNFTCDIWKEDVYVCTTFTQETE